MPSCAGFLEPRKSKLGPWESKFNAENFLCSFSVSISIDFGAIRLWNVSRSSKSPKNSLKNPILHSRSSKVIEFGDNREPVYDFLLVINSNLGPILHRYWDTATYWPKSQVFPTPCHLAPLFGVPLSNLWKSFTVPETRVFQAADDEDLVILACTVFNCSTRVTDEQTDRRTDRIAMAKTR